MKATMRQVACPVIRKVSAPVKREEPPLPSVGAMAQNLAKATAAEGVAKVKGVPEITEEQAKERFEICRSCVEWFRASDQRCAHPKCGCHLRYKVWWRSQRCPDGKW